MNLIGKLLILNFCISLFCIISNLIYFSLKENNAKKSQQIDNHIKNLEYKEPEDNDMICFKDESFNHLAITILMSFIPGYNIFCSYFYINGILFLRRKRNDKKDN